MQTVFQSCHMFYRLTSRAPTLAAFVHQPSVHSAGAVWTKSRFLYPIFDEGLFLRCLGRGDFLKLSTLRGAVQQASAEGCRYALDMPTRFWNHNIPCWERGQIKGPLSSDPFADMRDSQVDGLPVLKRTFLSPFLDQVLQKRLT